MAEATATDRRRKFLEDREAELIDLVLVLDGIGIGGQDEYEAAMEELAYVQMLLMGMSGEKARAAS
jgi:hypothetical protein